MKETKASNAVTTVCPHCGREVILAVGASAGLTTVEEQEAESRKARPLDAIRSGP